MIRATVTISMCGKAPFTYDTIGRSVETISEFAESLAGDGPFGLSIMVAK